MPRSQIIFMTFSASKNELSTNYFDMAETDNQRNHYRDHYWNESLDMFFPIINTCILECPIDSDHTYCQSKSTVNTSDHIDSLCVFRI